VFDLFLKDEEHSSPACRHDAGSETDFIIMREAIASGKEWKKPVVILYIGGKLDPDSEKLVSESMVPFFTSPNECIKAIESLIRYSTYLQREQGSPQRHQLLLRRPLGGIRVEVGLRRT